MRPLTPADPAAVGGHRLLGRLGSGGMGTVYLGRSPAGALLAVKVIRADHAADPAFRARFRREAEAAARLSGRWVVPVVAADPEARAPWLATPFVPGPSLSEAVAGYGPLPAGSVRTLGVRLAEALEQVHAAGLVHRDVKPGNILLAPDGPRLIDFGIARAVGATTLTAAGSVVGTPGYLPPEQAGRDAAGPGPAGDVFSLGCVLVYAATGRGPFGGGHPAAVVFRTVHDPPDLAGVPAELLEPLSACLAKDPAGRPSPAELRMLLGGGPGAGADWLPAPLPRLIAERSTRALALPVPEPTRVDGPGAVGAAGGADGGTGPARGFLTRRRLLAAGGALVAAGSPLAWLASRGTGRRGTPSAAPSGGLRVFAVGLQADLTGPGKAVGQAYERGVRLAVEAHNARDGIPFRLAVRTADDGGDPARAAQAAGQLIADASVVALIGPGAQAAVPPVAGACLAADLALLLVSLHSGQAGPDPWRTLCDTRADAEGIGLPVLDYLTRVRPVTRTGVVEDGAAGSGSGSGGWQLTRVLRQTPPSQGSTAVHRIPQGGSDFAAAVSSLVEADARAAVFAGSSPERAGRFARALADAGFPGPRLATGEVMEPAFLEAAGPAAEGWLFSTYFSGPAEAPAATGFVSAHRAAYGGPPARWAAEAYDAVGLVAAALAALEGEGRDRAGLSRRIFRTAYRGLAKPLAFDATTHRLSGLRTAHLHQVRSGAFRYLGVYQDVTAAP
ncbi:ABC transporter substrate-binding protein [Streptomyces sp. BR123]|uniref:bifunctional serine/threonine-protein kinase/ABC transporter substrate-binding protein n=1 Tax=Streptomyces sp. BR123 TaxID=2749828 RepID=UPI0015C43244|nr:bifunctional serine/threonine-protein kinase/ABC transporter substrate-binding protein [Streptomyces sp. BR123]NXY99052.1 ABC transporter substrate-binding protein [Streptomyces sp. BR123]